MKVVQNVWIVVTYVTDRYMTVSDCVMKMNNEQLNKNEQFMNERTNVEQNRM